jgi:hypothetical protein
MSESWSACSFTGRPSDLALSNTRAVCSAVKAMRFGEGIDGIGQPSAAIAGRISLQTRSM